MYIICSWHGGVIGEKAPFDDDSVTDGICPTCKLKLNAERIRLANIAALNAVEDAMARRD